jgi:hemerythrin-like domain-containing protein
MRYDPYTAAHKAQRYVLYKIAMEAGKVDYTNPTNLANIKMQLASINRGIRSHAEWEEKGLHPLLIKKMPRVTEKIEDEHVKIHHYLDILMKYFDDVTALPADYAKRGQLVQQFYLAFNRFILMYLDHIGYEEEQILPALWNLTLNQEFLAVISAGAQAAAKVSPEEMQKGIEQMLASLSLDDLTSLLSAIKAGAPPQAIQMWLAIAEKNLSPETLSKLKARTGV